MLNENNSTLKILALITGMISTICVFIAVLITLSSLDDIILIVIVISLLLLFCYLGAKLMTVLSMKHLNRSKIKYNNKKIDANNLKIEYKNDKMNVYKTKDISLLEFCNKVSQNNFTRKNLQIFCTSTLIDLVHLQRVINNKGTFIGNIFSLEWSPRLNEISDIEKAIYNVSVQSEKMLHTKVIRQRFTIACFFGQNFSEEDIKLCIARFDYTFSLYLPVVIDTQGGQVYHAAIPSGNFSAKGKAFKEMQKILVEYLYDNKNKL